MNITVFMLYFFEIAAALSAVSLIFIRHVFYGALLMVICLLSVAGLYVLMFAEFVAVTQVLVYAGGVLVIIIFGAGWIALRRRDWFMKPGIAGYLVMLIAGLVLGISVEWLGMQILKRWAYTESMPILPALEIGFVPVGQMLLVPPLTFRIVTIFSSGKGK